MRVVHILPKDLCMTTTNIIIQLRRPILKYAEIHENLTSFGRVMVMFALRHPSAYCDSSLWEIFKLPKNAQLWTQMDQNGPPLGQNYYISILHNKIHIISIFLSLPKILPICEKIHSGKDNIVPHPPFRTKSQKQHFFNNSPKLSFAIAST